MGEDGGEVFSLYANYYDALYQDKDYEAECDFAERLLSKHAKEDVRTILDLDSGTGGHAIPLARRGCEVAGAYRSEAMITLARGKAKAEGVALNLHQDDVRTVDLKTTFDVVLFMFAVIAYQATNADLVAALRTGRRHLELGGLLIFDSWYGPAVLRNPPTDRIKVINSRDDDSRIIRINRTHCATSYGI
ncbi:class I SAM-dependent methyltransferase [Nitrospinae bacterium AH_259_B05_G02_I21]|nr:class I SAM-dependent methyltransferase [Nitrospinae bacterium AH_259_B05_G02_I21]MDA2932520.1 class I SAM-dependent methyltransferase [Nitrospinae bacterium AH-259-F20]